MASISDTTLTFFSKASPEQWSYVLSVYRDVFKLHAEQTRGARKNGPADLIKLDIWYQEQLPQLIRSRQEPMLLYEEIVQVTKWRLLRGKFRPSILDLVKTNTETAVKNATKKAFRKMPNISAAISSLTQLKGVSSGTASAILVAHSPDLCPYMADENMASTPDVEASNNTTAEYMNYVAKVQECVDKLRNLDSATDWTPHKVELAMWTHYQLKQYNSNLIESMPARGPASSEQNADEPEEQQADPNECGNEPTASDENQVGSSEIDLSCNSSSNLVSSNKLNNDVEESSQHAALSNGVTQSDNESVSNSLSSTSFRLADTNSKPTADSNDRNSHHLNVNSSSLVEEDASNLSSAVSSNSEEPSSVQLNKIGSAGEEDSSSNNVSSTNGISRGKPNCLVSNGNGDESNNGESNHGESNNEESNNGESNNGASNEVNNTESSSGTNKVGSSLIRQQQHHFKIIRPQVNNVDSNLSLPNTTNDSSEKFSTISSSCENSSNNVNSSEDSLLLTTSKKRRNSSGSNSLSNLKASRACAQNCNADALDLNLDDNAVSYDPDSEPLSKRQKLIN